MLDFSLCWTNIYTHPKLIRSAWFYLVLCVFECVFVYPREWSRAVGDWASVSPSACKSSRALKLKTDHQKCSFTAYCSVKSKNNNHWNRSLLLSSGSSFGSSSDSERTERENPQYNFHVSYLSHCFGTFWAPATETSAADRVQLSHWDASIQGMQHILVYSAGSTQLVLPRDVCFWFFLHNSQAVSPLW